MPCRCCGGERELTLLEMLSGVLLQKDSHQELKPEIRVDEALFLWPLENDLFAITSQRGNLRVVAILTAKNLEELLPFWPDATQVP